MEEDLSFERGVAVSGKSGPVHRRSQGAAKERHGLLEDGGVQRDLAAKADQGRFSIGAAALKVDAVAERPTKGLAHATEHGADPLSVALDPSGLSDEISKYPDVLRLFVETAAASDENSGE